MEQKLRRLNQEFPPVGYILLLCLQQGFYISTPFENAAILRNTDV